MNAPASWQKSSFSGPEGDCVELAAINGEIALRESDEPHAVLSTDHVRLRALVSHIKAGQLDHMAREI
ncbi:DUF397 domain-containing protein [Streptomyces gobiensis]|uniref:DUF397 domain-containing protein n=1 Tax=Streptomyces gobiensis TaxID=2875706 RepID=UPI001E58468F|nr:DUF397 domain-containing protein [Streptomyces gobiensis]UGY92255.1 DUF397 domain-containing protein [Streptomyces gobiensis]